jgi:hypothetical protein
VRSSTVSLYKVCTLAAPIGCNPIGYWTPVGSWETATHPCTRQHETVMSCIIQQTSSHLYHRDQYEKIPTFSQTSQGCQCCCDLGHWLSRYAMIMIAPGHQEDACAGNAGQCPQQRTNEAATGLSPKYCFTVQTTTVTKNNLKKHVSTQY